MGNAEWVGETCKAVLLSPTAELADKNTCRDAIIRASQNADFGGMGWPAAVALAALFIAIGMGLYAYNKYN